MKTSDYKLVIVIWRDAESHSKWMELSDAISDSQLECASVGWLLRETDERVTLASSMTLDPEDSLVSGHLTIPRAMIVSIKELHVVKIRKKREQIVT